MNEEKFREAVIFICSRCTDSKSWGMVKLMKILFYADFTAYEEVGTSITGVTYCKLPQGPVPTEAKPLQDQMIEDRDMAIELRQVIDYAEKRPVALRKPDLSVFSAEEVAILERIIMWIKPMTGKRVSEISHDHPGWNLVELTEKIPYESALLTRREERQLDVSDMREILRSHNAVPSI